MNVDTFYPLVNDKVWKKGEPLLHENKFYSNSELQFLVSDAGFDEFEIQTKKAKYFFTPALGYPLNRVNYFGEKMKDAPFFYSHCYVQKECKNKFLSL